MHTPPETASPSRWLILLRQIVPPLPILLLHRMPIDIGTSLFWLLAVIACIVALCTLVRVVGRRAFPGAAARPSRLTLIRPTLTLVFTALAGMAVTWSYADAENVGRSAAASAQAACDARGVCPALLPGWTRDERAGLARRSAGRYAFYALTYRLSADGRSFQIRVRQSIDVDRIIEGGVGRRIEERMHSG